MNLKFVRGSWPFSVRYAGCGSHAPHLFRRCPPPCAGQAGTPGPNSRVGVQVEIHPASLPLSFRRIFHTTFVSPPTRTSTARPWFLAWVRPGLTEGRAVRTPFPHSHN
jgi:hypothetical protein